MIYDRVAHQNAKTVRSERETDRHPAALANVKHIKSPLHQTRPTIDTQNKYAYALCPQLRLAQTRRLVVRFHESVERLVQFGGQRHRVQRVPARASGPNEGRPVAAGWLTNLSRDTTKPTCGIHKSINQDHLVRAVANSK